MRQEIELMRVLRTPPLGKIVVELNGERVLNLSEIAEPERQRRILAAIGDLVVFAGGYQKLVDADVAPPLAAAERPTPAPLPQTKTLTAAAEQPMLDAAASEADKQAKNALLTGSMAPKMLSIAAQIDLILQQNLQANPALAQRKVHLQQSPDGGLMIQVDGHIYKRPNEIEDPQVRDLIKRSLKEWENS